MSGSSSATVRTSLLWSAFDTWGREFTGFVVFLILARILHPEAFGLLALASVAVSVGQLVSNLGIGTAIVQRQDLEPQHLEASFWMSLIVGGTLAVAAQFVATPIARLYGEPVLADMIRWLGLHFVLTPVAATHEALLHRTMAFRSLALRSNFSVILGGVVGVSMALLGYGVWSLVGQSLAAAAVGVVVVWLAYDWRPTRIGFTGRHARDLLSFGAPVLGANVVGRINQHAAPAIIGYVLGTTAVGYYAIAYRAVSILLQLITVISTRVALPVFSRLQHDAGRLRDAFYAATQWTSVIAFPAFVGLAAVSINLIAVLFGATWEASGPIASILALIGVVHSVAFFNGTVMVALGRPGLRLAILCVHTVANVSLFFLVTPYGVEYAALAYVLRAYMLTPLDVWALRSVVGLDVRRYLAGFLPPALAAASMAIVVLGVGHIASTLQLLPVGVLVCQVVAGAVSYVVILRWLSPNLFEQALRMVHGGAAPLDSAAKELS